MVVLFERYRALTPLMHTSSITLMHTRIPTAAILLICKFARVPLLTHTAQTQTHAHTYKTCTKHSLTHTRSTALEARALAAEAEVNTTSEELKRLVSGTIVC